MGLFYQLISSFKDNRFRPAGERLSASLMHQFGYLQKVGLIMKSGFNGWKIYSINIQHPGRLVAIGFLSLMAMKAMYQTNSYPTAILIILLHYAFLRIQHIFFNLLILASFHL